jgi:DMSO/TMAO reductase YedYZ heme-binding membrane subunit
LLILGLSYYARSRIGVQRWRRLHRFTALAWVLGLAHSLGEGTDSGQTWFLAMTAIVVLPALCLLAARWLGASREPQAGVAR